MTIRQAIYQWYNLLTPSLSDDTSLPTTEAVYSMLVQARSTYIRQERANNRPIPESMIQSIDCIPLKETSQAKCGLTAPEGCIWLKTKKLPTFLKIDKIANADSTVTYDLIDYTRAKGIKNSRLESARKGKYATIKDDTLYILNSKFLESVNLYVIGEDPLQVTACTDPKGVMCNPLDQDFFTTQQYLDIILKLAIDTYVRTLPAHERDMVNSDTSDGRA